MGISIWQLLIILLIVVLLFGTKKLRSIGRDMGGAVKGFRDAMREDEDEEDKKTKTAEASGPQSLEHQEAKRVIEGEIEVGRKEDEKV